ncbi:hypothetical protein [Pseudogemmobacter sonorensis]
MAFVRELIRQRRRDLTIVGVTSAIEIRTGPSAIWRLTVKSSP